MARRSYAFWLIRLFRFACSCVYRFEAERDERIRITIKKVVTSNRQCLSRVDSDTKRSYCFGDSRSKLLVSISRGVWRGYSGSWHVFNRSFVWFRRFSVDYGTVDGQSDIVSTWLRLQFVQYIRHAHRLHVIESSTWNPFYRCQYVCTRWSGSFELRGHLWIYETSVAVQRSEKIARHQWHHACGRRQCKFIFTCSTLTFLRPASMILNLIFIVLNFAEGMSNAPMDHWTGRRSLFVRTNEWCLFA